MTDADRADVFRGLAHPMRRQVLAMVGRRERMVSDILAELDVTMPALSRHLAILREAGLVRERTDGMRRYYRLHKPTLRRAHQWVGRHV